MNKHELSLRLPRYVGGQLEIQNGKTGRLYRGEIASAEVLPGESADNPGEVNVTFNWAAEFDRDQGIWKNDPELVHVISLISTLFILGKGDRLHYRVNGIWEDGVFYPRGDSKLDPSVVQGLTLA